MANVGSSSSSSSRTRSRITIGGHRARNSAIQPTHQVEAAAEPETPETPAPVLGARILIPGEVSYFSLLSTRLQTPVLGDRLVSPALGQKVRLLSQK